MANLLLMRGVPDRACHQRNELRVDVGETFRACEFAGARVRRDIGSARGKVRVRLGTAPPQSLFAQ